MIFVHMKLSKIKSPTNMICGNMALDIITKRTRLAELAILAIPIFVQPKD